MGQRITQLSNHKLQFVFLKHYTVYQIVTRVGKKKEEDTASKFRTHLLRITSV